LISRPIHLQGYYSQTYGPSHHNFIEDFIFDPWLEENLPLEDKAELTAKNVRLIWIRDDGGSVLMIRLLGLDGRFRSVEGLGLRAR
jgi:hypothetical protein